MIPKIIMNRINESRAADPFLETQYPRIVKAPLSIHSIADTGDHLIYG
jgi:hypothetical protein